VSLGQAPIWGLALVCALEMPEIRCRMIDLPSRAQAGEARALWQELFRDDDEREVALRGSERLVRRLRRVPAERRLGVSSSREVLERGQGFVFSAGSAPTLDKLQYVEAARRAPGAGEVEVEVRAADLNFLDVMTALGQVPRLDPRSPGFGGECAGVVTRVGQGVDAFKPGDEVIVVRGELGAIASHVTAGAVYVFHKPKSLDFEEASELPIAFLTAWYALHKLGRVEPGERVLIHSATGGTGLACVQVARLLGAEVYATAGSDEKRDYLRALGVEHVTSSRSLAFADAIMRLTGGRGVDVVVNSLAGEAAARGVACLAPYGRFVEIGKRDFLNDRSLSLRPFLKNLSYLSFDLRALLADQPARVREELQRLLKRFEEGTLRPLPRRVLHAEQASAALRQMTRAGHIGKLTLAMREAPVAVVRRPEEAPEEAPRGTWLLAGGLGGFGLQMAEDLARRGVRHLVLLGRSVEEAQRERAARIEQETGARVVAAAVDISDRGELERLLGRIGDMPPLKGVVHCAMVLDDRVLTSLTEEALRNVVRPKLLGALHLHALTAGMDLDAFVLFSSMTSMMGNQGQGNYAVANTFLDALAHHRRARGLPVTCVNWGVIADAGYVARHEGLKEKLAAIGAHGIDTGEAVELLLGLTRGSHAQLGAFRIDWRRYAQAALHEGAKRHPRYEELMVAEAAGGAASGPEETAVLAQLNKHEKGERAGFLEERLRKRVALVLGLSADKLDLGRPLTEYLDSLLVVEVVSWMEKEFGVRYTLMDIMRGPSVTQLAADILGRLEAAA
jgi:NADPH:quinone reductase-like Zn-dependent oxidoreductase/short-subunit dehydrogenase/acyl carrier protein